jgi:hypothetical protein
MTPVLFYLTHSHNSHRYARHNTSAENMASGLQCGGVGLGVHRFPEPTHTHPPSKHVLSAPSFVEAVSTLLAFSWWKTIWQNVKCFCGSRKLETTSLQTVSAAIHNQFGASELPHGRAQRQDKSLSSFPACFSRHKKPTD